MQVFVGAFGSGRGHESCNSVECDSGIAKPTNLVALGFQVPATSFRRTAVTADACFDEYEAKLEPAVKLAKALRGTFQ